MKKDQEINNIKGSLSANRQKVVNLTAQLDAARKQLYEDMIKLYQYENDINIGDTVTWEPYIALHERKYGFESINDEPMPEPIAEIVSFDYTDYTGIQIHVKRDNIHTVLDRKTPIKIVSKYSEKHRPALMN